MDRVAFLNASAHGIGRATALKLALQGYSVFMADIDEAGLETTAREIRDAGAKVVTCVADATSQDEVERSIQEAIAAFGRIDALACVAGGAGGIPMHQVDEIPLTQWNKVINLNLNSTYLACHYAVPLMRQQRYGRIVCLSSTVAKGRLGPVGTMGARLPYATAKAGLLGFTKQLAKDVGDQGITVNAVLPWLTFGEAGAKIRQSFEAQSEDYKIKTLANCPQKRPIAADGVAAAICFLLSEEAEYINGTEVPVDGGYLN